MGKSLEQERIQPMGIGDSYAFRADESSQGSVLGPMLYVLYTMDLPDSGGLTVGTFADDTAFMAVHADPIIASRKLQDYLHLLEEWLHKWKIVVNEMKSCHVTFTLR
jgi:hypothetical protein